MTGNLLGPLLLEAAVAWAVPVQALPGWEAFTTFAFQVHDPTKTL
jgi:hypothetical protein